MEDKVKFVSRKLKLKKQTNSVTQILETVHVLIFKLIVLLSFYCKKLIARKCPRVLYDSESSHNCSFIWLILCWPFLYQAWHYIILFWRCIYTFFCPIHRATNCTTKFKTLKTACSRHLALYEIWQCRECLVSPLGVHC